MSSVSLVSSIHTMDTTSTNRKQIRMTVPLCHVAGFLVLPVVLLFHPLPAHAKLDAGEIQQIQVLLEMNNKELREDMAQNHKELREAIAQSNKELREDMAEAIAQSNKELRKDLAVYPLLSAAMSVLVTASVTARNSKMLDATLKRFDSKKEADSGQNVFRSGLLGSNVAVAAYLSLLMAMSVLLNASYK